MEGMNNDRNGRMVRPGAVILLLILLSACQSPQSPSQPSPITASPSPVADSAAPAPVPDPPTPLSLDAAVAHALRGNPRLLVLSAQRGRAAGDRVEAGTWASPELRFGMGSSDEDSDGWSEQFESGTSVQSRRGTQNRVTTEPFQLPSQAVTEQRSSSRSRFTSTTTGTDFSSQTEDGFRLGLRYEPPNPWTLRADVAAARAAEATAACRYEEERHQLVCDIITCAATLAYHERIQALWDRYLTECQALETRMREVRDAGHISQFDYSSVRLRLGDARDTVSRLADQRNSLRREFQTLTGLSPDQVDLTALRVGSIHVPPPAISNAPPEDWADRRADVRAAGWLVRQCEAEWRAARAKRIPWFTQAEVQYAWWDQDQSQTQFFSQNQTESGSGSSSSSETELPSFQTEVQTGSERESQRTTSSGSEVASEEADGDEWWVGVGMEIPVFEWISRENSIRRRSAQEARYAFEQVRSRAHDDVRLATATLEHATQALAQERKQTLEELAELRAMAALLREVGLEGEIEALQVREHMLRRAAGYFKQAISVTEAEVELCRMSGLMPGRQEPTEAAGP